MLEINKLSREEVANIDRLDNFSLVHYQQVLYCDIENKYDFSNFLMAIEFKQICMGLILSKSEKEDLEEEIGNFRISTVKKINKKEFYVE